MMSTQDRWFTKIKYQFSTVNWSLPSILHFVLFRDANINELHETHIEAIRLQFLLKNTFKDFAGDIPLNNAKITNGINQNTVFKKRINKTSAPLKFFTENALILLSD